MLVHCNRPTAGQETLMDRIRFVTQGDQRILLLDFTNCTAQEVSAIADQAPAIVAQEPSGSVLVVADFRGAEFSRNATRCWAWRAAWFPWPSPNSCWACGSASCASPKTR